MIFIVTFYVLLEHVKMDDMISKMMKTSLSIFFPCYNDSRTIGGLVRKANAVARKITSDYEIIVIDDGSKDKSRKLLKKLKKRFRKLKIIFHDKNRGYGGVLQTGLKNASKDLIFYTDGDGQYDVGELPILVSLMSDDVNFVNGIKMDRRDYAYRVVVGNFYALVMRWAFALPIVDVDCDFRLIRKALVKKFVNKLNSTSGSICVELVKRAQKSGGRFRQVSVHHFERRYGNSQFFKPIRLLKTFSELIPLWYRLMLVAKT